VTAQRVLYLALKTVRTAATALAVVAVCTLPAVAQEPVRDGAEALDYLFRRGKFATRPDGHPAVVLLDLKMPKVNGLEVLHKINLLLPVAYLLKLTQKDLLHIPAVLQQQQVSIQAE
jgi:CheY-like chemotaxis protein